LHWPGCGGVTLVSRIRADADAGCTFSGSGSGKKAGNIQWKDHLRGGNTIAVLCLTAWIAYGQSLGPQVLVLEKDEGEKRVRLPREGVANRPVEFILKITPETAGSQHLVLGTR
jgi:hypothetical protein